MRAPREVAVVWALLGCWLAAVLVTYARLPAAELYHVSGTGLRAGLSRALVELNYPVALIAICVLATVAGHLPAPARAPAWVAAAACAVVAVPGVVRQSNLDARWVNAVPAAGAGLACACSLFATGPRSPTRAPGDRLRVVLAAVLGVLAAPWIAAGLGFYLDGVPILGWLFQTSRQVSFHDQPHHAVHHGVHHGLDGLLLVLAALLLSRLVPERSRPRSRAAALLLALALAYGAGNVANDAWLEQVAERGWVSYALPSVLEPGLNWLWLVVLATGVAAWLSWLGRQPQAGSG